jgi:kynureninase
MPALRKRSEQLTFRLERGLEALPAGSCTIVTPKNPAERGAQLSLRLKGGRRIMGELAKKGVICDFREPDIIRVAPAPLYTNSDDVDRFLALLSGLVA